MPNLDPLKRKYESQRSAPPGYKCRCCREGLRLVRKHLSPPRLGPPVATEFYQCSACDSGYALNPETGVWKLWAADDE